MTVAMATAPAMMIAVSADWLRPRSSRAFESLSRTSMPKIVVASRFGFIRVFLS
jgi:hypothetical protein